MLQFAKKQLLKKEKYLTPADSEPRELKFHVSNQ
ncbi:unnamed protein product [Staurois parvus]|uniref:Uncharacterized protein n=1 Tax=Staurois parvus TaxID=386267 RepID=A0ABN9FIY6_9NEOB|nr:unnamed protein product [Staurois parvus]